MKKLLMLPVMAVLAAMLLLTGCASVPMAPAPQDMALKAFEKPPEGKAGIYIYRDSIFGAALKKRLYLNDKYLGQSAMKTYFYQQVNPGEYTIRTQSEFGDNSLKISVKEGLNYFVRQYIKWGVFVGGANVKLMTEEKGREGVLKSRLVKSDSGG